MIKEKFGLIDIGSNTVRLVVFAIEDTGNYYEIQNIKTPARLSLHLENRDGQTYMTQAGIDHLVSILQSFAAVANASHLDHLFAFATAAVRQSSNQDFILETIKQNVGMDVQLLSEDEEAFYGQFAVLHTLDQPDGLTVDIGGGSCEITLFRDKQPLESHSFPFGAVSLKNQFLQTKAFNDPSGLQAIADFVNTAFKSFDWIKKAKVPIIAMSGSARNIAQIHQNKIGYPLAGIHAYQMDDSDLDAIYHLLTQASPDSLNSIDGLSSDRQDIILPALIVFQQLYQVTKTDSFIFSNQGLREGILLNHLAKQQTLPTDTQQIRARTINLVGNQISATTAGDLTRSRYAVDLYQAACQVGALSYDFSTQNMIEYAAFLYHFGAFVSAQASSQHTFYLLSNMDLMGFNHTDRLILSLLASYKNKTLFKRYSQPFENWLVPAQWQELQQLGGLIKFADALNDSKTQPIVRIKLIETGKKSYRLDIYHNQPVVAEIYRTSRQLKHLERSLKGSVTLNFISLK